MMYDEYPPLFCGTVKLALGRRVIVDDPLGLSPRRGAGILRAVEVVAGQPWRVHVDLGPNLMVHVPPEWISDDPAAAPNVLPFRRAPRLDEWPSDLFRDVPARNPEGAA